MKVFKAGLYLGGRLSVDGDIPVYLMLAEAGKDYEERVAESRKRSQTETKSIFWTAALDEAIDRETVEVFRSKEILSRKERSARTKIETALVSEEKLRLRDHTSELKRRLKEALLAGSVTFRGNDRSPDDTVTGVGQVANRVLAQVLPDVFERFEEGAAKVTGKDLEALLTNANLRGLPQVFTQLDLIRDQNGQPVFNTDAGPLKEVIDRIENRTSYGETATGRYLVDEFGKEPFGWNLDVIRLFVVSLLRAGTIKATSKGTVVESALSVEAKNTFTSNNLFRAASLQKKQSGTTINDWLEAEEAFRKVFGKNLPELQAAVVAEAIRTEVGAAEEATHEALGTLLSAGLPGSDVLQQAIDQMRAIRKASEDDVITGFNGAHKELKEANKRSIELEKALTEPVLHDLARAEAVLDKTWPFLAQETDVPDDLCVKASQLEDLMQRETFYRELATIEQHTTALEKEYCARFDAAVESRAEAYAEALEALRASDGWDELNEEQQSRVSKPLAGRASAEVDADTSIPFLRSELSACPQHLKSAIQEMMELIDGNRLVTIAISDFFSNRVETPEQLQAALKALKERCEKLIGEGKKVLVQ